MDEADEMAIYAKKYQRKSLAYKSRSGSQSSCDHWNECKSKDCSVQQPQATLKGKSVSNKLRLLKNKRRKSKPNDANIAMQMRSNGIAEYIEIKGSVGQQGRYNRQQHDNDECVDEFVHDTQRKIIQIEKELESHSLNAPKKYALNKKLKMEKSKIIRYKRKKDQEKRRFEAGL